MRRKGAEIEELACKYMEGQGFKIIGRNVRIGLGEIDILATENGCYVFVEVRYRRKNGLVEAEQSLSRLKIIRLKSAIVSYMSRKFLDGTRDIRVDLCAVTDLPHPGGYSFNLIKGIIEF